MTLTTAAMLFVLLVGRPDAAEHSRTFYELYFLVIMSAGLRYDWRLCALDRAGCASSSTRC